MPEEDETRPCSSERTQKSRQEGQNQTEEGMQIEKESVNFF
jgi:hypothetical protein